MTGVNTRKLALRIFSTFDRVHIFCFFYSRVKFIREPYSRREMLWIFSFFTNERRTFAADEFRLSELVIFMTILYGTLVFWLWKLSSAYYYYYDSPRYLVDRSIDPSMDECRIRFARARLTRTRVPVADRCIDSPSRHLMVQLNSCPRARSDDNSAVGGSQQATFRSTSSPESKRAGGRSIGRSVVRSFDWSIGRLVSRLVGRLVD